MKPVRSWIGLPVAALATALFAAPFVAVASTTEVTEAFSAPLFSISKTENRNYVQFTEQLDAACAPLGGAPVRAYWRMLERNPNAVEPILPIEQQAYGVASQTVVERSDGHGVVRITLRALPTSPLLVESRRAPNGQCEALARLPIAGVDARLFNVHAVLRWPFGVARLLVSGWATADGHPVRDTRTP